MMKIGAIMFLIQNFYFGWNAYPESELEETIDLINQIIFGLGLGIYLFPLFDIYEKFVKKYL